MLRIKRPFALISFSLLLSYIFLMVTEKPLQFIAVIISVAIGILLTFKRNIFAKHLLLISFSVVFAILSFNINLFIADYSESFSGEDLPVSGIISKIETGGISAQSSLTLKNCTVGNKDIFGKIKVYSDTAGFSVGDRLSFTAVSLLPRASEGKFLYHTLSSDTFLVAFPDDASFITDSRKSSFFDYVSYYRTRLREIYSDNLNNKNSAVITALITGDTADFSPEFENQLKYSGASHIFAVSGIHLSLWTSFFFLFFKRRAKTRFIPNFLAIIFVILYSVFTGFSPSVMRAGIMLITVFLGRIIKRQADSLNSLGISGTALLVYEPFLAGNVSFLLSFIATFALIFFSDFVIPEKEYKKYDFFGKRIKNITSTFIISLCVILTTLPVTALFFGYTSLLSPLSSVIITPFASGAMVTGLISALLPVGNIISEIFFFLTGALTDIILLICSVSAEAEPAVQATPKNIILPWFILSLIICAGVFFRFKDKNKTFICILTSVALLLSFTAVRNTLQRNETLIYIPGNENATMLSVVNSSSHYAYIFGTGGSFTALNKTTDYLNSKGILRAEALILPRNAVTENKNTDHLSDYFLPEKMIRAEDINTTKETAIALADGSFIRNYIADNLAVSAISKNETKIVICTLPTSDFSGADEFYKSGDILITRNCIPESLDKNGFDIIIIMTERHYKSLPENTYSTADGDIEIILKGDSYAVQR
ncbi:MAG: ComEC/Rec2 family competence protein [Clostridia bacterium]|nr:ComEC/Rec2 family competence protein [Clostridia bacterium]